MQPQSARSKRSWAQVDEKENHATATLDATRHESDERAARRLRMEGQTGTEPPAAIGSGGHADQFAAAAACASPSRVNLSRSSKFVARADKSIVASDAATAAVDQQAVTQQSQSLSEQLAQAAAPQTAAAVAARRPLGSPAQRCDPDSLSIVYAHLGTSDFLAVIRVCRQWRSARLKPTAWPQLHLSTLVRWLRDDNYGDPDRRRLNVAIRLHDPSRLAALLGPAMTAADGSVPASAGAMWRHVTDARLSMRDSLSRHPQKQTAWESSLQQLAHLPFLSVLNLQGCIAGSAALAVFYRAVAPRLHAFILSGGSAAMRDYLPQLRNLRVLVLDRTPAANQLISLHQLEYLHFDEHGEWDPQASNALTMTLRWLSSEHSLRSLSVDRSAGGSTNWEPLFRAPVQPSDQPAQSRHPAAAAATHPPPSASPMSMAIDWSRPCGLTDVSMNGKLSKLLLISIYTLPQLTRLQCDSYASHSGNLISAGHRQWAHGLAKLQQLRLHWLLEPHLYFFCSPVMQLDWMDLPLCTSLRVLHLSAAPDGTYFWTRPRQLQRTLAACADTLEELRMDEPIRLEFVRDQHSEEADFQSVAEAASIWYWQSSSQVPNGWNVLAQCTRLRVLETALQADTADSGMLEALSQLPSFQSLELIFCKYGRGEWPAPGPRLPPNLLQHIAHSRSWCSVHIRAVSGKRAADLLSAAGGLDAQMPVEMADEATAKRLRVYEHKSSSAKVLSYAIRTDEHGVKSWQMV